MSDPAPAQGKQVILIEAKELARRIDESKLRVVDVRSGGEYAEAHIPGAVRLDVAAWKSQAFADGGFEDAEGWSKLVGVLGIERDSSVVVYGDRVTDTARIWWTLKYLGVEDAALLNGGWQAWTRGGLSTESKTPKVAATKFQPDFQADRLMKIDELRDAHKAVDVAVLDTRSDDEYTGVDARGKRGGHIPGAIHLEWSELLGTDGRFKSRDELRKLFQQRGVKPEQTACTY